MKDNGRCPAKISHDSFLLKANEQDLVAPSQSPLDFTKN